jgi:hypothetical protein
VPANVDGVEERERVDCLIHQERVSRADKKKTRARRRLSAKTKHLETSKKQDA